MLSLDPALKQSIELWPRLHAIRSFLTEIGFPPKEAMPMFCDNQAAIYIANNPVFYERTKYIEVDCHFVRNTILDGLITTSFTTSSTQLVDVFTKAVSVT